MAVGFVGMFEMKVSSLLQLTRDSSEPLRPGKARMVNYSRWNGENEKGQSRYSGGKYLAHNKTDSLLLVDCLHFRAIHHQDVAPYILSPHLWNESVELDRYLSDCQLGLRELGRSFMRSGSNIIFLEPDG